jgi:hypothetical protein
MTLQQPYCWTVMDGRVKTERRTHQTTYRGPIAIVAGKHYHDLPKRVQRIQEQYPKCPDADGLAFSAIVGVVDLVDVWETDEPGMRYVWELRKPRRLKKPKPYTGSGGTMEVEAKLVRGLL